MSHRTEIDGFSGHQFHPGHGIIYVREDKHMMAFESPKTFRMWERKRNPRKISWTEHYRFDHKKSNTDQVEKKGRVQRSKKISRGYAGVSVDANAKIATTVVKKRVQQAKKGGKK
ncbi:60S ribosomal protein L24 [Histomonas meleagridis]|uniref:60S ribosomal protein L24 n=1 Tax=Histomonas meleagridis TaxID=135588 RepID=UPI0035595288|nr:60S ribosomal protein L24 [Histomonas meleagridis]KAH0806180.1 60S ribosomal protein L24 [Histomonas meleagridis]